MILKNYENYIQIRHLTISQDSDFLQIILPFSCFIVKNHPSKIVTQNRSISLNVYIHLFGVSLKHIILILFERLSQFCILTLDYPKEQLLSC